MRRNVTCTCMMCRYALHACAHALHACMFFLFFTNSYGCSDYLKLGSFKYQVRNNATTDAYYRIMKELVTLLINEAF